MIFGDASYCRRPGFDFSPTPVIFLPVLSISWGLFSLFSIVQYGRRVRAKYIVVGGSRSFLRFGTFRDHKSSGYSYSLSPLSTHLFVHHYHAPHRFFATTSTIRSGYIDHHPDSHRCLHHVFRSGERGKIETVDLWFLTALDAKPNSAITGSSVLYFFHRIIVRSIEGTSLSHVEERGERW